MPFTSTDLAARVEAAESRLIDAGAKALLLREPDTNLFVEPLAGGVASATVPGSPFNKLAGMGFSGSLDADELARVERAFAARGIPVQAEVATLADPTVFEMLVDRGYRLMGFENVLGLDLSRRAPLPVSDEVDIAPCQDDEVSTWIDIAVTGFATPDTQGVPSSEEFPREELEGVMADMASIDGLVGYLARLDGEPVGEGALRIDPDGIAQLCGAATLPAARRRGVQTALLARRLADAEERGCDLAVVTVQPGSKSGQNVQKWGFELLYVRAVMRLDPSHTANPSPTASASP